MNILALGPNRLGYLSCRDRLIRDLHHLRCKQGVINTLESWFPRTLRAQVRTQRWSNDAGRTGGQMVATHIGWMVAFTEFI